MEGERRLRGASALLVATAVVLAGLAGATAAATAATGTGDRGGSARASAGGSTTGVLPATGARVANDACEFPTTVTDATGTEVRLTEEPDRVTTTGPAAAQTMWEIGAEGKVVGVTQFATYLDGAENRTNVSIGGSGFGFDTEKVIGTEPDLVLVTNATNNGVPERVETLRAAGIPVYVAPLAETFGDVHAKTRTIGRLVGACEAADERANRTARELEAIREVVGDETRPVALYYSFGFTVDEDTFVHEMLRTAGARNFGAGLSNEAQSGYFRVSTEVVVAFDTEWIVRNSDDPTALPPAYNETTAVQEGNVVTVSANYVSQPAPRIVRPVRQMARAFHAEAYEAANESDPDDGGSPAGGGGDDDGDDEDDDGGGGGGGGGGSASARSTATPTSSPTPTATPTATESPGTPTPTPTPTGTATATATGTPTGTAAATATGTPTGTATPTTSASNPGLGSTVALVALLAVALLARRR